MDEENVSLFEKELFRFYNTSYLKFPFERCLNKKNNKLSDSLLIFVL